MLRPQDYRFIALGGGNETGGSCYALKMGGSVILLDTGIRYSADYSLRVPDVSPLYSDWNLDGLWELDALIFSHAHLDHTGALPVFMRNLHGVSIYSSEATPDMLSALYHDNFFNGLKRDIASMSDTFITLKYGCAHSIKDFSVTLYPAGHMPGAAMTLIENEDCKILYSGDFCMFDQFTVKGAEIPEMKVDTLICESTHGYGTSPGGLNLSHTAAKINTLLAHTDVFTCTVRNSGKAAEISAAVSECVAQGLIPEIDIWIDTGCEASCRACEKHGTRQIFSEHVRPLERYSYGLKGMIITGRPSGGLYDVYLNMSNHADSWEILRLIQRTKPDRVIFVHGVPSENGTHNIINEVRERFGTSIEVIHSTNLQEINLLREC